MSISNLFSQNDFNLYCNDLTCKNLIPGSIVSNNAIYRFNIDPTSNPDPYNWRFYKLLLQYKQQHMILLYP